MGSDLGVRGECWQTRSVCKTDETTQLGGSARVIYLIQMVMNIVDSQSWYIGLINKPGAVCANSWGWNKLARIAVTQSSKPNTHNQLFTDFRLVTNVQTATA